MFPFDNVVNNLFNLKSEMLFGDNNYFEDKQCPKCKTHLSDLKETSFVGCEHCYRVFNDTIRQMAYRYHGRVEHLGKIPVKQVDRASKLKEIERLEKLKKQYADAEDYEQANAMKRKIEQIRSEMK